MRINIKIMLLGIILIIIGVIYSIIFKNRKKNKSTSSKDKEESKEQEEICNNPNNFKDNKKYVNMENIFNCDRSKSNSPCDRSKSNSPCDRSKSNRSQKYLWGGNGIIPTQIISLDDSEKKRSLKDALKERELLIKSFGKFNN